MDKETLSNYGWIVVLVLILAVMLALATPFGTFIAGAIKSTTAGLFNVNQAALGSAGINVDDLVFENCDHLETELRNVTDTYTGDTCCKACGAVLQAGQTVRPKVPDGATYTAADGTVYGPGEEMPEVVTTGDKYRTQYYEYSYNQYSNGDLVWTTDESQNGWGVDTIYSLSSYPAIIDTINGEPVTCMRRTYYNCQSLKTAPAIPKTVTNMREAFKSCLVLEAGPDMSNAKSVETMYETFWNCTMLKNVYSLSGCEVLTDMTGTFVSCKALVKAPELPNSVTTMKYTFCGCTSLTDDGLPNIPNNTKNMYSTFSGCTNLKDISQLKLPTGVENMERTFSGCTLIINSPVLPETVTNMFWTFNGCTSLVTAPVIPNSVTTMHSTFYGCENMKTYQGSNSADGDFSKYVLPSSTTWLMMTFENCKSMEIAPAIPNSVNSAVGVFRGCTSLTTAPVVHSNIADLQSLFFGCTSLTGTIEINTRGASGIGTMFGNVDFEAQNLTLTGTSTRLDDMGATGINYCTECNGACKGNH